MNRYTVALIALLTALSIAGCSTCRFGTACDSSSTAEKRPKTLLAWAVGKDEKPDNEKGEKANGADDKNNRGEPQAATDDRSASAAPRNDKNGPAETDTPKLEGEPSLRNATAARKESRAKAKKKDPNGNGANGEAEEEDAIVTDRPDFTESSKTVGKGRVQLETGYTFVRDRANASLRTGHSYPETLLRVGMFAEWFEFRLGQNFANERTAMPDGSVLSSAGAEDLYVGFKLALTEQQKWLPEMGLIVQMTVPSGSRNVSAGEVLPGINWLYGWDVIRDRISIAGSTQANRMTGAVFLLAFDGAGQPLEPVIGKHAYLQLAQSLTIGYTLTKKLSAYTEWFAFFPHSALDPEVGPEHYLNGGFTYKFTPNTQFDIRAGFGLNWHADDFFAGSGFAFRY